MQATESPILSSPSFNSYSSSTSSNLSQIAARVVEEFRHDSHVFTHRFPQHQNNPHDDDALTDVVDPIGDDDFEFAVVPGRDSFATTISAADDIFYNGQIRPIYPLFNMNLLLNDSPSPSSAPASIESNSIVDGELKKSKTVRVHRPSLGKLMSEERDTNSCSSSEADELDGIVPGTYCVWSPKVSLERCKKSNSMGSSKRWKLRDLLHRSNSDGKDVFVFLAPNKKLAGVSSGKGIGSGDDERIAGKLKASRVAAATAVKGAKI